MQFGRVKEEVVLNEKIGKLKNKRLFLVEVLDINLNSTGKSEVMIDFVGARVGDIVLFIKEGGSVQSILGDKEAPFIYGIIGIVDEVYREGRKWTQK